MAHGKQSSPPGSPGTVHVRGDRSAKFGISAALTTPFAPDGSLDTPRLVAHARDALSASCRSVTLFGTTGEGASVGARERQHALRAMVHSGIDPSRIVFAIQSCSPADTIEQAVNALAEGCRTYLLAPPFYFKTVSDDGLQQWFSSVVSALPAEGVKVILYHIPQVTQVPLSIDLVRSLKSAFPNRIYAVKDSSGDFEHTSALLADRRVVVLVGDERHLAKAAALGAEGSISGLANVASERLATMLELAQPDPRVDVLVDTIVKYPVTAAVKVLVAHQKGDAEWRRVRPPLTPLPREAVDEVTKTYKRLLGDGDAV